MITRRRITQTVYLGVLGNRCIYFDVLYSPGVKETGRESEIDIIRAMLDDVNITRLIDNNRAIYDMIIDELDSDDLEDRREIAYQKLCTERQA